MKLVQYKYLVILIIAGFTGTGSVYAQTYKSYSYDSTSHKSQLRIALRYTSDYYYMGRSDSAKAPYLSPSISYYHKSGFFIRSSVSYLTAKDEGRIDMISFSGGYNYYINKLTLGASISHYFFSDLSYNVLAEMSTYLNSYIGYDFNAFALYGDASLGFSGSTDLFLGAEITRTFYTLNNNLLITPSLYMNAGSQKYYNEYYKYRSVQTGIGGNGKGKGVSTPTITTTPSSEILESDQFKILDYEASLQLMYKINKIRLFTSSTWTFPVNPATLVNDQGEVQETLTRGFFWSSGIRITL